MADFQVLFDTDGVKIEKPLWGSTHVPNQDIDPEHWDRFWEQYSLVDTWIWLDSSTFTLTPSGTWVEGFANYSHQIVTDSGGILTNAANFTQYYDSNDAMSLKDVTSVYLVWSAEGVTNIVPGGRVLSKTYQDFGPDEAIVWYFHTRPNELDWEIRLYFGNFGNATQPSPNSPQYYLSVTDGAQVLYVNYGSGFSEAARGNLQTGPAVGHANQCIYIHPSRDDRIYIGNGFSPQTNNFFYRVPFNEEYGSAMFPIIPQGKVGVFVKNTSAIFSLKKYIYPTTAQDAYGEVFGPIITLPDKVDVYNDIVIDGKYRMFGNSSVTMGFADENAIPQAAGWETEKFRFHAELRTTDARYSPEIYRISLRRLPTRSIESNEEDQTANVLQLGISQNEDLTNKQVSLHVKDNVDKDFQTYAGRRFIPIRVKYLGKSLFLGLSGNNPFKPNKLQSLGDIEVWDFWKRMEYCRLGNVAAFDGMLITDVYEEILLAAGLGNKKEGATVPNFEIYDNGTRRFPMPRGDADPAFMPKQSTTVAEFLLDIRDEISRDIMYFTPDGTLMITRNWFAGLGDTEPASKRTFYTDSAEAAANTSPYVVRDFSQEVDDSDFANVVYVIGEDKDRKKPLISVAIDYASLNDINAPNYVGFEIESYHFNSGLCTQEVVNEVCLTEWEYMRTRHIVASWKSAWDEDVHINDVVTIEIPAGSALIPLLGGGFPTGYESQWRVTGINTSIGPSTLQRPTGLARSKYWEATYTALRLRPATKEVGFVA